MQMQHVVLRFFVDKLIVRLADSHIKHLTSKLNQKTQFYYSARAGADAIEKN